MCGTLRQVKVLHLLLYVLHCTMPILCFFSSKFHCSWHSALQFTLGKEPFSHSYSWTQHMSIRDLLSRILLPVFFHNKSGITIAKPIDRMHIGVFLGKQHVHSYCLLYTYHRINWLYCLLSYVLLARLCLHECVHICTLPICCISYCLCNHCKLDPCVCDVCDSDTPMALDFMILMVSPGILSM